MKDNIINLLSKYNDIANLNFIIENDSFKNYHIDVIKKNLDKLEEENKIAITTNNVVYLLGNKYLKGTLKVNQKGFGFLNNINIPDMDCYFIPSIFFNNCINNDIVVYSTVIDRNEKIVAKIEGLILREKNFFIGEIVKSKCGKYLDFTVQDKSFENYIFYILDKKNINYEEHQLVKMKLKRINDRKIFVTLIKVLGDSNKAADRILSIAEEFSIKTSFNRSSIIEVEEIAKLSKYNNESEFEKRKQNSLENKVVVTIDGEDSKDLDDAICIERTNCGYKLYVAIADVSHYVKQGTALDEEALTRSNSTYLANSVIPMLPKILSNELCSLNPNTKKLVLVCEMDFDNNGIITNKKIYESVINTRARLSYNQVNDYFNNKVWNNDLETRNMLDIAYELYIKIDKYKFERGTISFDIREPKIILDKNSNVINIKSRTVDNAEKLIEQFMVSANESVAELIFNRELPFIYRTHEKPLEEELILWYSSLKTFDIETNFTTKEMIDPKNLNKFLDSIQKSITDPIQLELINLSLLRHMEKAQYSLDNVGHFGLSSKCYTHFTSPIRRYADLIVHRYLKEYLLDKNYDDKKLSENEKFVIDACKIINKNEVKSIDCEREVIKSCMVEFMNDKIGNIYDGVIVSVLKFGFFVQLENMVEGLVHISNIKDELIWDEKNRVLIKKDNSYFQIGQKVKIQLVSSDIKKRTIDFVLI